jgi:hypothetical protein
MNQPHKSRILPLMIGPIPVRELVPVLLIGGLLLGLYFGFLRLASSGTRDQVDATVQQGSGTVTNLTFAFTGNGSRPVFMELDGRPVNLELWDDRSVLRLQVGQKVHYRYRVGRSGTWYVEQIAPVNGLTGL